MNTNANNITEWTTTATTANSSGNQTDLETLNDQRVMTLIPVMVVLGLLMVIGFLGNSLVCYIFCFRLRSGTQNFLIVCLACFDLLSCTIAIPSEILDLRYYYIFPSEALCKIMRLVNAFTAMSSILTLVVIAVDRYRKICKPFAPQIGSKQVRLSLILVLGLAFIFSCPAIGLYGIQTVETQVPGVFGKDCSTDNDVQGTVYPMVYQSILFFLFLFFATTLGILYSFVLRETKRHNLYLKRNSDFSLPSHGSSHHYVSEDSYSSVDNVPVGHNHMVFCQNMNFDPVPEEDGPVDYGSTVPTNSGSATASPTTRPRSVTQTTLLETAQTPHREEEKEDTEGEEGRKDEPSREIAHISDSCNGNTSLFTSGHTSQSNSDNVLQVENANTSQLCSGSTSRLDDQNDSQCGSGNTSQLSKGITSQFDDENTSEFDSGNTSQLDGQNESQCDSKPTPELNNGNVSQSHCANTSHDDSGNTSQLNNGTASHFDSGNTSYGDGGNASQFAYDNLAMDVSDLEASTRTIDSTKSILPHVKRSSLASSNGHRKRSLSVTIIASEDLPHHAAHPAKPRHRHVRSKTTIIAFLVTLVFILSFLPHLSLQVAKVMLKGFDSDLKGSSLVAYNIFLRSYFINSVANPFIYAALNMHFKKEVRILARKIFRKTA